MGGLGISFALALAAATGDESHPHQHGHGLSSSSGSFSSSSANHHPLYSSGGGTRSRTTRWRALAVLALPPVAMVGTAVVAGALGRAVVTRVPAAFVGFLGFAGVSLLFLVTQELLVEARVCRAQRRLPSRQMRGGYNATVVGSKRRA
jgi:hypothetical protein